MTNQESGSAAAPAHLLRRRSSGRVIGGVAGGLGDYFNIDPLLVRIGFVGLMVFGGAGLVLYVIAWLLIPDEGRDTSSVENLLRRLRLSGKTIGWIGLTILALLFLQAVFRSGGYISFGDPNYYNGGINSGLLVAIAVIVIGVLVLRRQDSAPRAPFEATVGDAVEQAARPAAVVPRVREHSPLGWYTIAALLLTVGGMAIFSQSAGVTIHPGQYFGAVLGVIGLGLVIGAWVGRARIMVLLALLILPLAVMASFVTVPLRGGVGDVRFAPSNAAELRGEYRMIGGRMVLDLTDIHFTSEPIRIAASVAFGELVVIVPDGASLDVHTRVGLGESIVFDARNDGSNLADRFARHSFVGPNFILDLENGIGQLRIESGAPGSL
jgi:phage shock protein PspC (stress-responsive transcriptional regulator)